MAADARRALPPLRKIVGEWHSPGNDCIVERLECGHEQPARFREFSSAIASHRRCRRCAPPVPAARPERPPVERIPCEACGGPIFGPKSTRYCSNACFQRAKRRQRE